MRRENCKSCGVTIEWSKGQTGKWTPMELDGTSHFKRCPQAAYWSSAAKPREKTEQLGLFALKKPQSDT